MEHHCTVSYLSHGGIIFIIAPDPCKRCSFKILLNNFVP